jgi:3-oxoacyl-[acyl-carrier protein] reductase
MSDCSESERLLGKTRKTSMPSSVVPTTVKNPELVEKRREQIVLAAIKLFSQKGFHKTTLRDLAEESGLSQGNIYDYVGTKEDIFFLIHQFAAGSAMAAIKKSIEDIRDPMEKFRRMIRAEFNTMDRLADAIMLIYQEGHILDKPFLRNLLRKERGHLELFEAVIEECQARGLLRDCNPRVISNLVKSMVDAWVLKRWDLRGYATALEMEETILNLLFKASLVQEPNGSSYRGNLGLLTGQSVLVINAGTFLGTAVLSFLASHGVRVVAHLNTVPRKREYPVVPADGKNVTYFAEKDKGPATPELFRKIEAEFGPMDICIHDMGIGNLKTTAKTDERAAAGRRLEENLANAQDLAPSLYEQMSKRSAGRIIYLAPWSWDKFANPIRYETVKGGTIALTKTLAKTAAQHQVNVNCILPGFIKTTRPSQIEKELANNLKEQIPARRLGEVTDLMDAVLFFAGDASKYVTGQVLGCTGGDN